MNYMYGLANLCGSAVEVLIPARSCALHIDIISALYVVRDCRRYVGMCIQEIKEILRHKLRV